MLLNAYTKFANSAAGQKIRWKAAKFIDEPLVRIPNFREGLHRSQSAIPCHVMQTWETHYFSKRHGKSIEQLRMRNPDLDFRLISGPERDEYMRKRDDYDLTNLYFASNFRTMQSDIFRYAYIYDHGGYYLDVSMNVSRRLSSLHLAQSTGLISFEKTNSLFSPPSKAFGQLKEPGKLVCVWAFAFAPKHEVMRLTIDYIKERSPDFMKRVFASPKAAIISLTGPVALTNGLWSYFEQTSDDSITQWSSDYEESGSPHPGAGYRHLQFPTYANARPSAILNYIKSPK